MADKNTIIFRMGEETGIVIEKTQEQFEHSPFKEQYRQAFVIADGIVERTTLSRTRKEIDESASNIIAFIGDRGEGKTSCLQSFLRMLTDEETCNIGKNALDIPSTLNSNDNLAIEMLDPSFFDEKHNIVELVLGQLYEQVVQEHKSSKLPNQTNAVGYRTLMSKFAEAQSCLSALAKKEDMYDSMNELSALAASIRLRKAIKDLFKAYLEYYGSKKKLIISIDDIDLNMHEAYPMAEEIRKYLNNEYCIILMAVKIGQLHNAIKSAIRTKAGSVSIVSNEEITEMAHKYLTKFIPENNRVLMPSPDDIADTLLEIYDRNGQRKNNIKCNTVKETIVRLIFNKTRFLFYNGRSTSAIVPHNLRDMRQLIGLLAEMQDIHDEQNMRLEHVLTQNKLVFKNYFYHSWVNKLTADDKNFASQLASYKDIISINKFVVTYLGKRINSGKNMEVDTLFDKIVLKENRSHNISVGDVYYVVRQIEKITTDQDIYLLLFFVRSYYSMRLYELYDEITTLEAMRNSFLSDDKKSERVRIYKYDSLYDGTNVLQKFLNGSYFTYSPGSLVNDRNEPKDSPNLHRDIKTINGDKLARLIEMITQKFQSTSATNSGNNKCSDSLTAFQQNVQRCEYFILCSTHQLTDTKAEKDRTAVDPPFIGKYDNIRKKYLAFDFLAIFYNVVNIRYAFERFGDIGMQLFKCVIKQNWTLTSKLFMATSPNTSWPKKIEPHKILRRYHRFLSDGCIRVSEIQQSIIEELTKNRLSNLHKEKGSNTYKLRKAYEDIQKLEISLYPYYDENLEHIYKIPFRFLTPIIQFLEKEKEDDFNDIYILGNIIEKGKIEELFNLFPSAKHTTARKRDNIISTILRKDHPELPDKNNNTWKSILTEESYNSKIDWLAQCIKNLETLKKYIKK